MSPRRHPHTEAIAAMLRQARTDTEMTHAYLARAMAERGHNWPPAKSAATERGRREATASELLDLCAILGIDLADLTAIAVPEASDDLMVLGEAPVNAPPALDEASEIQIGIGESATRRAAATLGVPASIVAEWAVAAWGHSLGRERDNRVAVMQTDGDTRDGNALRAIVTKELTAELQTAKKGTPP